MGGLKGAVVRRSRTRSPVAAAAGGGGGKATKSTNIIETHRRRRAALGRLQPVDRVRRLPELHEEGRERRGRRTTTSSTFKAQIFWSHRTWEATILEQVPDERIVWRSKGEKGHVDGAVTFHELGPNLTRILVVLEYYPQGLFEKTGNIWEAQGRRARAELRHFRRHVMTRTILDPDEVEGWRGDDRGRRGRGDPRGGRRARGAGAGARTRTRTTTRRRGRVRRGAARSPRTSAEDEDEDAEDEAEDEDEDEEAEDEDAEDEAEDEYEDEAEDEPEDEEERRGRAEDEDEEAEDEPTRRRPRRTSTRRTRTRTRRRTSTTRTSPRKRPRKSPPPTPRQLPSALGTDHTTKGLTRDRSDHATPSGGGYLERPRPAASPTSSRSSSTRAS